MAGLARGGGALAADGEIDVEELAGELLELAVGGDFALGLAPGGLVGEALGDGFAVALVGEAPMGAVAGLAGLVAAAGGLAATAPGGGDGAGSEVTEGEEALEQGVALGLEIVEGVGHGIILAYITRKDNLRNAGVPEILHIHVAHPGASRCATRPTGTPSPRRRFRPKRSDARAGEGENHLSLPPPFHPDRTPAAVSPAERMCQPSTLSGGGAARRPVWRGERDA